MLEVNDYPAAWMVILGAAFIGAIAFERLLVLIGLAGNRWLLGLRLLLVASLLAAFTIPSAIPGSPDINAPAFIVYVFESLFQNEGQTGPARRALILGLAVTFVAWCLVMLVLGRRKH